MEPPSTRQRHRQSGEKKQRLGGRGLSLEAFANAKSKRPDFNPSLIRKQREFYKNAKLVSKYKKTLKQLNNSEGHTSTVQPEGGCDDHSIRNAERMNKKKKNTLLSLEDEYEKTREEKEKTKMERESIIQTKKEEREKAETRRKALKSKIFKKTRSGQPVMKYRIEHLLEGIQGSKDQIS